MDEYRKIFSNKITAHREAVEDYGPDMQVVKKMIRHCGATLHLSPRQQLSDAHEQLSDAHKHALMRCFTKLGDINVAM